MIKFPEHKNLYKIKNIQSSEKSEYIAPNLKHVEELLSIKHDKEKFSHIHNDYRTYIRSSDKEINYLVISIEEYNPLLKKKDGE